MNETEDQFVQATKQAFANLGFAGSFCELRCREIFRRVHVEALPSAQTVAEQLSLL